MLKEKIETRKIIRELCEELKNADEYEQGYLLGFIEGRTSFRRETATKESVNNGGE